MDNYDCSAAREDTVTQQCVLHQYNYIYIYIYIYIYTYITMKVSEHTVN